MATTRSTTFTLRALASQITSTVTPDNKCALFILDCKRHESIISFLAGIAAAQKNNFIDIFPWESRCLTNDKIYVSISLPSSMSGTINLFSLIKHDVIPIPEICGWMRVGFKKFNKLKFAHVSEISTSKNKKKYSGIGSSILKKLEEENIDFIELIPLITAKSFYIDKMNYQSINDSIPYLFKIIRNPPTQEYLINLSNEIKRNEKESKLQIQKDIEEIYHELDDKHKNKFVTLIKKNEINKFVALEIYQNSTIDDVIEWIDSS